MRAEPPLVARHGHLREQIADKSMELDGRVCSVHDVHVKDTRRSSWRKRADPAQPDAERRDRNVTGHHLGDGGAPPFVDLADENESEVHLLRPDETQLAARAASVRAIAVKSRKQILKS
jgi:hypothetical protein